MKKKLRFMLMKAHYRQPLDWSESALDQARRTLDGLYTTLRDLATVPVQADAELPAGFLAALADDLNTPEAMAQLARLSDEARRSEGEAKVRAKAALLAAGKFLGLLQNDPEQWFRGVAAAGGADDAQIQALVDARLAAKKARDFAQADQIRADLLARGVVIEDTPQGPRWKRVSAENADECTT